MRSVMMSWTIAAAALVVVAGSASAQTYKADIQLTFRAGHTLMTPGSYQVSVVSGMSNILQFHNLDTNRSVVLIPVLGEDAPKAWVAKGKPVIAFLCGGAGPCVLAGMWNGVAQFQYKFPARAARGEQLAEVLVPLKAD
jgi:hypothetical protein